MLRLVRRCSSLRGRQPRILAPVQYFSSKPSVVDGVDGILHFANRAKDRVPAQMDRYRQHSVFPPDNWELQNFILFTKLQLPTNTEIDAVEFLNGARFACDLAVHTMYSQEFINFATGAISTSPAAEKMQEALSAGCYEAFLFAMKKTSKTGNRFTLQQLDIKGVHLYDVDWDRMSLAELKQEDALEAYNRAQAAELEDEAQNGPIKEEDRKVVELKVDIQPEDHSTMVERLRLDVLMNSVEHLEVVTADSTDQVLEKKSSAVWRFESLVTQPEDVDWRIVSVF